MCVYTRDFVERSLLNEATALCVGWLGIYRESSASKCVSEKSESKIAAERFFFLFKGPEIHAL